MSEEKRSMEAQQVGGQDVELIPFALIADAGEEPCVHGAERGQTGQLRSVR